MRTRLFFAMTVLFLLVPSARPSLAALLGIQIVAEQNSGSGFVTMGTAVGGPAGASSPLQLNTCCPGNTVRFTVRYDQVATFNAYGTAIAADDPTEMDFIPGSAADLSGKGFAGLGGNPNNSMNDATPGSGLGNSAGAGTVTGRDLYVLEYVVTIQTSGFPPDLKDFTVNLASVGSGNTLNTAAREASVSLSYTLVGPDCPVVPEPLSFWLVLSGLAGLAGSGLLRRRR